MSRTALSMVSQWLMHLAQSGRFCQSSVSGWTTALSVWVSVGPQGRHIVGECVERVGECVDIVGDCVEIVGDCVEIVGDWVDG